MAFFGLHTLIGSYDWLSTRTFELSDDDVTASERLIITWGCNA